jgi:hypothetical protein
MHPYFSEKMISQRQLELLCDRCRRRLTGQIDGGGRWSVRGLWRGLSRPLRR